VVCSASCVRRSTKYEYRNPKQIQMSEIQNSKLVFAERRCVNERRFDGWTAREYRITNIQCRMSNFQSDYGKEFRIENEELTVKRLDG
jgi:hypothetical protein